MFAVQLCNSVQSISVHLQGGSLSIDHLSLTKPLQAAALGGSLYDC